MFYSDCLTISLDTVDETAWAEIRCIEEFDFGEDPRETRIWFTQTPSITAAWAENDDKSV